jgi:hypothetical protein
MVTASSAVVIVTVMSKALPTGKVGESPEARKR